MERRAYIQKKIAFQMKDEFSRRVTVNALLCKIQRKEKRFSPIMKHISLVKGEECCCLVSPISDVLLCAMDIFSVEILLTWSKFVKVFLLCLW